MALKNWNELAAYYGIYTVRYVTFLVENTHL